MTIGSILLGFALLIVVILFLARPFMAPAEKRNRMTRRQALLTQKEVILDQLKALDFDHETAKLPEEVYQGQRAYLIEEAAKVLKELDEYEDQRIPAAERRAAGTVLDDEIEAAIARYRGATSPAPQSNGGGGYCPQCGEPSDPGDRFCFHCGHKLPHKQPA